MLFHQRGLSQTRVYIYGAGQIGVQLAKRLYQSPSLGLLPVGFLDDDASKVGQPVRWTVSCPKAGVPVLGGEEHIKAARSLGVEMILIALPSATFERNQTLVEACVSSGLNYAIVPNAYEKFIQRVESYEIGGIPLIRRRELRVGWYYLIAKRLIDLVLSTLFLAALSPLVFVIGLAIKLDSKGPVLFKQKRVGLNGREFSFYKFRSMYTDAPKYARTPADPSDPRITKVGRWIRRTSLDELPQLFNVFRGDMSLWGRAPRCRSSSRPTLRCSGRASAPSPASPASGRSAPCAASRSTRTSSTTSSISRTARSCSTSRSSSRRSSRSSAASARTNARARDGNRPTRQEAFSRASS